MADPVAEFLGTFGTPQEGAQRETLTTSDIDGFVAGRDSLIVDSSWLEGAHYFPSQRVLRVTFKDGHVQGYGGVTAQEARSFAQAKSKGKWLHSVVLGVRFSDGTWQHLKPKVDLADVRV